MNPTRCHSGRRPHKLSSSSESTPGPQSRTSCRKKKGRVAVEVSDWGDLLRQISNVTQKVEKLCNESQKGQISRSRTQTKPNFKSIGQGTQIHSIIQEGAMMERPERREPSCNPDCHMLMYECMKLSGEKMKLIQEKEELEKRLYFESKEKRELRWKLEKEREKEIELEGFRRELLKNNSFTLRLSKATNLQRDPLSGLSQSSYLTAKKSSPLRQRSSNLAKGKQNKDEDSLLIDLSVRDSEAKKSQASAKILKSVGFEKDLQELLQMCKQEPDQEKKRILRKRMKQLAQQIKSLKSE